jgi:hypothetical protein
LFYGNGINGGENGVTFLFEFFDGTGLNSATYTSPVDVAVLEFAIYDVDGEADQSEFFRAYKADGLKSYQLGSGAQALSVTDLGDAVLFEGSGKNFDELDATGAAILVYEDTRAFTLDFGSVQTGGPSQNPVFTAFDGNMSLFKKTDFAAPVGAGDAAFPGGGAGVSASVVPQPWGLALLPAALGTLILLRRRRSDTAAAAARGLSLRAA